MSNIEKEEIVREIQTILSSNPLTDGYKSFYLLSKKNDSIYCLKFYKKKEYEWWIRNHGENILGTDIRD